MSKMRYETGKAPAIRIEECIGDLFVRTWSEPAVQIKGEHQAQETEGGLTLSSQSSITVTVPEEASLSIGMAQGNMVIKGVAGDISLGDITGDAVLSRVGPTKLSASHGNLTAKNVEGMLSVQAVHGDAIFRNVGELSLELVHGNLVARQVGRSLTVNEVHGDMSLRQTSGDVTVQRVQGNARVKAIGGVASIMNVQGDLDIADALGAGKHFFSAQGNLVFRWPVGASLNLDATAYQIHNRLSLVDVVQDGNSLSGRIGEGDTTVTLEAQGEIILKEADFDQSHWDVHFAGKPLDSDFDFDFDFDFGEVGRRIREEMDSHLLRLTSDLEQRFGPDLAQRIADKVAREVERAAERAEHETERAAARAERAAERAQRQAERHATHFARMASRHGRHGPPPPPPPPTREVSAEEQLKILRMVENGTISPEEANMLLKALEKA